MNPPAAKPVPGMQPAPTPRDEGARIAALRNLDLLDTPPSESFDRITRLASELLGVPITLVSLVAEDRQWFKSKVGLAAAETSREVSFCAHAVYNREPLVVPDATLDPRFAGNPLVTGSLGIRAYLGIPLLARKGQPIGTLCAIDVRPHGFDEEDLRKLHDCAKLLEETIHSQELAKINADLLRFANERAKLFRDTFEQAAVGMTHTSLTGNLLRVNARTCEMLGYTAEELTNISFLDITHPDDIAKTVQLFDQALAGDVDQYRTEKRYVRKDGTHLWTDISVALKRDDAGRPEYVICVIEDIAARKQAESDLIQMRDSLHAQVLLQTTKLRESNEALQRHVKRALESEREVRAASRRLRGITDSVPAMMSYWNRELRCEFANEMYRAWFGVDPVKIVGWSMQELLGEDDFNRVEPHAQVALEGHPQSFENTSRRADGELRTCLMRYVPDRTGEGAISGFYVLATDVTESRGTQKALQEANAKLTADSVTDFLTGLSNRRVFSERSEEACRRFRGNQEIYGLILLDLDNFKQINDAYGHEVGDEVLRVTGQVLKGQLRSHRDIAARLGGEEFAVLCFGELDEGLLREVAERLRAHLAREVIQAGERRFHFTGSFGLALSDATDTNWKNIYSRADAALYEAKASGKDRVAFGDASACGATGKFRALRAVKT